MPRIIWITTFGLITGFFASALFLLAATSVFAELKGSLDELWGIDEFRHPPFIEYLRTRLLFFTLVLVLALLLLISIIVSATLVVLEGYTNQVWGNSAVLLANSAFIRKRPSRPLPSM